MKFVAKWTALLLVLALMICCAVGCGKSNSTQPGDGQSTQPQGGEGTEGTTLPAGESVEEWGESDSAQHSTTPTQNTTQQGSVELPTDGRELTIEEYESLTTSQKQAYFESFATVEAFYDWLDKAEANRKTDNTVTGDGNLNLGDYVNKNP